MAIQSFYILAALILPAIFVFCAKPPAAEDIGSNFFLKASKSVPRIGRRTVDYENHFLKASKSIPRIGRRTINSESQENTAWLSNTFEPAKKSFFEKFFKENEQPVWSDLEKIYQDYPGIYSDVDIYPESAFTPKLDPYWPKPQKTEETLQ